VDMEIFSFIALYHYGFTVNVHAFAACIFAMIATASKAGIIIAFISIL
jgi:hypothetical protein